MPVIFVTPFCRPKHHANGLEDGVMNLELRKLRQPYLDRKEPLPEDLDKLLKSKQISVPWKADTEWHDSSCSHRRR